MNLSFHSDNSEVTLKPRDRRSVEISSTKKGRYTIEIFCNYKGNKIALIVITALATHI